jgi:hypothetical protein
VIAQYCAKQLADELDYVPRINELPGEAAARNKADGQSGTFAANVPASDSSSA